MSTSSKWEIYFVSRNSGYPLSSIRHQSKQRLINWAVQLFSVGEVMRLLHGQEIAASTSNRYYILARVYHQNRKEGK
jgi:hypothetical protein